VARPFFAWMLDTREAMGAKYDENVAFLAFGKVAGEALAKRIGKKDETNKGIYAAYQSRKSQARAVWQAFLAGHPLAVKCVNGEATVGEVLTALKNAKGDAEGSDAEGGENGETSKTDPIAKLGQQFRSAIAGATKAGAPMIEIQNMLATIAAELAQSVSK
jgi:hypothetical protein